MKKQLITKSLFICAVLAMSASIGFGENVKRQDSIRHNGIQWLYFGDAIINSSKIVEVGLTMDDKPATYRISQSERLEKVKKWLNDNFQEKMNFSPTVPSSKSVLFINRITLYSSTVSSRETMLLTIPLTPFTLDCAQDDYKSRLRELEKLCKDR